MIRQAAIARCESVRPSAFFHFFLCGDGNLPVAAIVCRSVAPLFHGQGRGTALRCNAAKRVRGLVVQDLVGARELVTMGCAMGAGMLGCAGGLLRGIADDEH